MESDILKNKWVWFGGAAVIALVFLSSRGGASGGNDLAGVAALNSIGAQVAGEQIQSETQMGIARYQYDAGISAGFFSTINNMNNNAVMLERTYAQANAGITNSIVTTNAATVQDIINQNALTQRTQIGADTAYKIAQANARAASSAAKAQASSNLWGTIAGDVTKLAGTALAFL